MEEGSWWGLLHPKTLSSTLAECNQVPAEIGGVSVADEPALGVESLRIGKEGRVIEDIVGGLGDRCLV
jgi:hypothetical protein